MPPLKWMRAKRVPRKKCKLSESLTAGTLSLAALLLAHNASANSLDWSSALTPQVEALSTPVCEPSEDIVWVWAPHHAKATVNKLLIRWQEHPLAALGGCLQPRLYHHNKQLQCSAYGERQHLRCELPLLPREVMQRHIVFTDAEIASASTTQMVLPLTANLQLMAHEMAHWFGFADEYTMSPSLAQQFCQGRYDHPSLNVVMTQAEQLTGAQLQQLWQRLPWRHAVADWRDLGQQQDNGLWDLGSSADLAVGLFASQTCAAVDGVYSWKPVAKMTAMEYHDVNYWPAVYLETARELQRRGGLRNHDNGAE